MLLFRSDSDNFLSASALKKFNKINRRTPLPLLFIDISSSDFIYNLKSESNLGSDLNSGIKDEAKSSSISFSLARVYSAVSVARF